ncbi:dipeptidyl carboxypeptidase [Stenotrophomonas pictorum JCM 9942]|uniref:Dipeptidyl carboxypeptidase n=1 Tax=Stenotrophomonas pictorum JCM 9942 TaxID=1236960 RepID=A0A0R0AV68_9GAMM|nr:peptidyl-dipeptidase Dcp [Stenotrophomonas pictorum]KRG45153.1 dipeptidyl carboxypeptidase [Stenotrophomonas pictorum JCM 9942]
MSRTVVLATAISLALAACSGKESTAPVTTNTPPQAGQPADASTNPFMAVSPLPFQAPAFDKIKDSDYLPAFAEGMRQHLAEIKKITDNPQPATFDNTLLPMEKSGAMLDRVSRVFFSVVQADTNPERQKIQGEVVPQLAAHSDAIYLDAKLFERVKAVYDARQGAGLEPEQLRVVEETYKGFVKAGAQLSDPDKETLKQYNAEEATLSNDFHNKLVAATAAGAVVIDDKAQLAGLSDGDIAAAEDAAKGRKLDGKWVLSLQNTTQQPALGSLQDRDVRAKVLQASETRTEHGDTNDTRAIIQRLAQLRAAKAKLLGFPNYAAYNLTDQMAQTPEHALKLLTDTVPAATAKARGELAEIQKVIDAQKGGFKASASDWDFYAEQVRKAKYDLDESQIKPYFELDNVLQNGVFYAANQLYGLTFKERKDLPVYHPDVRVFEVTDANGQPLALFYADFFKRDSKSGGAWMDVFVEQDGLTGTKPVVYNVSNFTKPAAGQPALLSWDDVTTMFHEFGHALHGMFSNTKYPSVAGTGVPRDFVEFPSQFNEHWASDPKVFANYAKHYQTKAAMPQELVDKIAKAKTFNQGYMTTEYLSAALLDLAWHTQGADAPLQDVDKFEADALKRYKVDLAQVPPRYRSSYFDHIWGGGYSAGYYAYFWAEMIDHDAFEWFKENGGLTRENGQVFRDKILSIGNTRDLATAYRDFRGKDPSVEPLLKNRGLK